MFTETKNNLAVIIILLERNIKGISTACVRACVRACVYVCVLKSYTLWKTKRYNIF